MDHVEDIIQMLDSMAQAGVSRIKVEASDEIAEGTAKKSYHHGRDRKSTRLNSSH